MLKTKSILASKEEQDHLRYSVMSRHTLNDGITPHPKINDSNYDEHLKILAPPEKLVGDYYKRSLSWDDFEKRYLEYIRKEDVKYEVQKLAEICLEETITLLCVEETPEFCHRRLLAEECQRYQPNLEIMIE